jgi:hypothetical protein
VLFLAGNWKLQKRHRQRYREHAGEELRFVDLHADAGVGVNRIENAAERQHDGKRFHQPGRIWQGCPPESGQPLPLRCVVCRHAILPVA